MSTEERSTGAGRQQRNFRHSMERRMLEHIGGTQLTPTPGDSRRQGTQVPGQSNTFGRRR